MIKLVLADMDGTLVPFTAESTSRRTLAAVDALRAHGIEFGCATGRTNKDVTAHFYYEPAYTATGIYASGKQVFARGEQILSQPMPPDVIAKVARAAAQSDNWLFIPFIDGFDPERPYSTVPVLIGENPDKVDRILADKVDPETGFSLWPGRIMLDEVPQEEVFCLGALVEGGQANIESLYDQFYASFPDMNLMNSADGWCDVNRGNTNKSTPFPLLLEAMGIGVDEVAFLADSENDIELMKLIPNSFCVAGGAKAALNRARSVIPSAEDDGPAQFMEALAACDGDLDAAIALL